MKEIYDILRAFRKRSHEPLGLATLVGAEGSSYRRAGARMLICADGWTVGSLSGGCIEEEVAQRGQDVIGSGQPTLMSFDTRKRFGCHGKIEIFIERIAPDFLVDLSAHLEARRSCFAVTTRDGSFVADAADVRDEDREAHSFPSSRFVQEIHPPVRLLIFGDGPDSAPLTTLSELLGWKAIGIVDPNRESIEADDWTAALVKSHHYGRDFAALQKLLPLNLRYVGLIGPRKRRDQLLNDLLDLGVSINAGFFAPAGLDIGAEGPEQIALAVVSEIQRVITGSSAESLRERKNPIHADKALTKKVSANPWAISAQ